MVQTSYLPERHRTASHIKRGYEICRGGDDWIEVKTKKHDQEHQLVLFTFVDDTEMKILSGCSVLSRRGTKPEDYDTEGNSDGCDSPKPHPGVETQG